MTNDKYAKAYTEVLEILKYLPQNEYNKIDTERIKFFEANSIIIVLFRDYFATETQKKKLNVILKQNEYKYQEEIKNKYNLNDIFKARKSNSFNVVENNNLPIEVKENNFFKKLIAYIKNLFRKKEE